ncbi:hypothetical protein LTR93_011342 [Exophiala xenobiotica]|nr:hypothetical protein LTR93_011342 [Exophiala xenobiotica]
MRVHEVHNPLHQPDEARIEALQIQQTILLQRALPSFWVSMITKASYRKRTLLAVYVCFASQMCSTFTLSQYNPRMYGGLRSDTDQVLQYTVDFIAYAAGMPALSVLISDQMPRHHMMAIGILGTTFCMSIVAALIAVYTTLEALPNPNNSALKGANAMIYIACTWYQLFYEPVQFAFLAEIFPTQIRAIGMTIGVSTIVLVNIMWFQTGPIAFQNIGWKFYLCFAIPMFHLWFHQFVCCA